jgi:plastocyanin
MKIFLVAMALLMLATPALAKEYIIKEVSNPEADKPYYFEPDHLTIQPGDTVTFVNAQEDMHDVMFDNVPKAVTEEMIMSPMLEQEGEKWSYTFTVPGSYHFHCHPHESLGMKGTLVVGEPSAPGETRAVSHEEKEDHVHDGAHEHGTGHHTEGTEEHTDMEADHFTVKH